VPGCFVTRRYGRGDFQPWGNSFFASSSDTEPAMMTSSPCFQLAGVATLCLAVSCIESSTRRISSKLRPVVIGYVSISLIFLSGPMMNTDRTVWLVVALRPSDATSSAGSMLYSFEMVRSVSPMIG
jgi:hypothetical protein